jgi:acetaldehyde dehydrogenase (acetylating)
MSITTLSRKRLAVLATGAVALASVGLAASAHAGTDSPAAAATGSTSGPEIHFWTLGEAKAGATIDVFAECGLNKNGIVVTTAEVGGVAKTTLTPQADGPYLIGEVTLAADFAGPSALSLTCDNQATATTTSATTEFDDRVRGRRGLPRAGRL